MSTSYYKFRFPVTSVKILEEHGKFSVTVFVNNMNSGKIIFDHFHEANQFRQMLVEDEAKVWDHGSFINVEKGVQPGEFLLSENNVVMSLAEVLANNPKATVNQFQGE